MSIQVDGNSGRCQSPQEIVSNSEITSIYTFAFIYLLKLHWPIVVVDYFVPNFVSTNYWELTEFIELILIN